MRPSELWGITWPLAAFYFDRAVRNWANFVDRRCDEAEMGVRQQMRRAKGNTDGFVAQAREVAFNKLLGLNVASAYAAPPNPGAAAGDENKRNLDSVAIPRAISAEGKRIDLSRFNG